MFGVGGDSGSSISTTVSSLVVSLCKCLDEASAVVPNFPFSHYSARQFLAHHAYTCLQWGQRQSEPHRPARYVFSCLYLHTHSLARPSLSDAKFLIHLACLQYPQNLRKPMESSVPSSELPSKCPVVILILKTTNLMTKTLASLNNSEQGPRFCRL